MKKLILLSALLFSTVHAADLTVKADALTTNNPAKTVIDVKKNVDIQSTGGLYLPSGTTAQQPAPYKDGMIRYNSTLGTAEIYSGGVWGEVGGSTTIADWVASTDYEAGEFVIESLKLYRALLNHTASLSFATDLANGDWEEISPTGTINLASGVTGVLPISNGGTGSASKNFVDLTTNQTVAGNKTFVNDLTVNGITSLASSLTGPLKAVGGVVSSGNINAATELTGITPIANGGTGNTSGTATINANLTGEVTSVGNAATVTNDAVIAKTLTGFASAAGTISSTDSILQALQKADGNTALKLGNTKSDADGSSVITTELQTPNDQLTTTDTNKRRIETGNGNLLSNPSFEAGTYNSGWTCSLGSTTLETTAVTDGKKSLGLNSIGAGVRCYQTSTTNAANLKGLLGSAILKVKTTDTIYKVCGLVDGNAAANERNCITVNPTSADLPFYPARTDFYMGGASNGIVIYTTTTTSQPTVIDDAFVGVFNGGLSQFSNNTGWIPYTPTTPNSSFATTPTGISGTECLWKRRDTDALIRCKVTAGTVQSVEARLSLPIVAGVQLVSAGTGAIPSLQVAGIFSRNVATGNVQKDYRVLIEPSVAYFTFSAIEYTAVSAPLTKLPAGTILLSGETFYLNASLPIAGWEANTNAAIAGCVDAFGCENTATASVSSAGVISGDDLGMLASCSVSGTSKYTCLFRSNGYSIAPKCGVDAIVSAGTGSAGTVESVTNTTLIYNTFFTNTTGVNAQPVTVRCTKRGADFKPKTVVVSPLQGYVKVPGAENLNIESFSVSYAGVNAGTPSATNCTTGTCNIDQIGTAVSKIDWSSTGLYLMYFPKNYTNLKCTGSATNVGSGHLGFGQIACKNCSSVSMPSTAAQNSAGTINCIGVY